MAEPDFFNQGLEAVTCVCPLLHVTSTIISCGGSAETVLTSQKGFWDCIQVAWFAVTADLTTPRPDAYLRAAACIVDMVTCALHHQWDRQNHCSTGTREVATGARDPNTSVPEHASASRSADPSATLMAIFENMCAATNTAGSCLHDCLEHWGSHKLQDLLVHGEGALIKACQAAALLV